MKLEILAFSLRNPGVFQIDPDAHELFRISLNKVPIIVPRGQTVHHFNECIKINVDFVLSSIEVPYVPEYYIIVHSGLTLKLISLHLIVRKHIGRLRLVFY